MSEIKVDATIENVTVVTAFIEEQLKAVGCPMNEIIKINIAVDEIMANIASYAYGNNIGEAMVDLEIDETDKTATIKFTDSGIPYNPLEKEDPDIEAALEDRQIGGLGIFIVKKTMDDMIYNYIDGYNVLTIVKKYQKN